MVKPVNPLLLTLFWANACATPSVPGIGKVHWSDLCSDDSCGVQGTTVRVAARAGSARILVPDPSFFLGTTMTPSNIYQSPDTCGGLASENQWGESASVDKEIELTKVQKRRFKANVKADLTKAFQDAGGAVTAEIDAAINRAVTRSIHNKTTFKVVTYTLTAYGFEDRKRACAQQTDDSRIVRSITTVRASMDSAEQLQKELKGALEAEAAIKNYPISGGIEAAIDSVSRKVTTSKVTNYVFAIAFGFDDPTPKPHLPPQNPDPGPNSCTVAPPRDIMSAGPQRRSSVPVSAKCNLSPGRKYAFTLDFAASIDADRRLNKFPADLVLRLCWTENGRDVCEPYHDPQPMTVVLTRDMEKLNYIDAVYPIPDKRDYILMLSFGTNNVPFFQVTPKKIRIQDQGPISAPQP